MENNYGSSISSPKPMISSSMPNVGQSMESIFNTKNTLIIILVLLLVFSLLGINLIIIFGNLFQSIVQFFEPLITQVLSVFGYTTGLVIEKSADVVTNVGKTGLDIAGGAIHSVGDLLIDASSPNLNQAINRSNIRNNQPSPDSTTNPIQNPITSGKANWCLVGEYEGRRGCISITDQDKCLSGQVFPTHQMCLNPTLTKQPTPLKSIPE